MIPKSLSATALNVWQSCPRRFAAETLHRTPGMGGRAADLGSVCHSALEGYVQAVYIDKTTAPGLAHLLKFYETYYMAIMGAPSGAEYEDGVQMLSNWYPRSAELDDGRKIINLETKENFTVKTSAGPITFNYIFDRLDRRADGSIEVVDYKSIRARLSPDGLKDKLQARIYAVAAQIRHPDAERVWVTFDLLRYDPIGIVFTREENLATWRYIRRMAQDIVNTDVAHAEERINPECRFCIRKHECETLKSAVDHGALLGITDPLEAARIRAEMENRLKGLEAGINELDKLILLAATADDTDTYEDDDFTVTISSRRSRTIPDQDVAAATVVDLLGPDAMNVYGTLSVTAIDRMLKDPKLDEETQATLRGLIKYKSGDTKVYVKPKNPIDS